MASPFPGMDPYLESHWGDIHTRLIIYASDQLRPRLPKDLRARVEERVFVEAEDQRQRSIYPDVRVVERPFTQLSTAHEQSGSALAVCEPIIVRVQDEAKTETFLEIREVGGGRVITVIEFVSPANKMPGKGRDLYLRKQRELESAGVNSVEIDLLRGGEHIISCPFEALPQHCRRPYRVCVRRVSRPLAFEIYPVSLRASLPTIRIPLRENDPDVLLNLQELITQSYENGDYNDLDYTRGPDPPLDDADSHWAATLLREQGRR
jgi:hypothetical protein